SRRAETRAATGIRDVPVLAGNVVEPDIPAPAVVPEEDSNHRSRTLPGSRAGGSRLHHESPERQHHRAGIGGRNALRAEMDGSGGDGSDHRGRVRVIWI